MGEILTILFMLYGIPVFAAPVPAGQAAPKKIEILMGRHFFNVDQIFESTPAKYKFDAAVAAVRLCKEQGGKYVQAFYVKRAGKAAGTGRFRLTDVFCHEKRWSSELHELARAVIMRSRHERGLTIHRDGIQHMEKLEDVAIDGYVSVDRSPAGAQPLAETPEPNSASASE